MTGKPKRVPRLDLLDADGGGGDRYKILFLNSVFLLAGAVAFAMGFLRWQESHLMGAIDFVFVVLNFGLLAYLRRHREKVELVGSLSLALAFVLFYAVYLLAPYNTMRLSLFFLLSAAAFFLKGRMVGRLWLVAILCAIVVTQFIPGLATGYSHFDLLTTCVYLLALLFIFENYESFKEQQQATEEDLKVTRLTDERLRLTSKVFEHTLEGIIISDLDGKIIEVNNALTEMTGYSRKELIGNSTRVLQSGRQDAAFYQAMWRTINEHGHWRGEVWNRKKDGEFLAVKLTISAIHDAAGRITHYVGISSDITLIKQHAKQLEHIAHYDALTGVPNRVLLADRLQQALAHAKREGTSMAVCYLDLDGFKAVNDTMGHEAGDQVLVEVTMRIKEAIRADDTVARLGGDEFAVLLMGLRAPEECSASLNRLLESISQPIELKGRPFEVSASIGVALYPDDDLDADALLRHADQAMYVAKQSGKNRYHLYDAEHDQRARSHNEFLRRIEQALKCEELQLYFQPKVNLRTHQAVGVEALLRWRHPERGVLPPAEFLHMVEGTELELELGDWVIAAALAQLQQWQRDGIALAISINIAASHLQQHDFLWKLKRKLLRYPGLPAGSLQIEILETAALDDIPRVRGIIEQCRRLGVHFALDDFGTGYSSLSYLGHLPVDTLKIDQSFVRDMLQDKGDRAIVQGVIALAQAFERATVAEGVETMEVYRVLLEMGCEFGQGYAIARPMPAVELPGWLAQWHSTHMNQSAARQ